MNMAARSAPLAAGWQQHDCLCLAAGCAHWSAGCVVAFDMQPWQVPGIKHCGVYGNCNKVSFHPDGHCLEHSSSNSSSSSSGASGDLVGASRTATATALGLHSTDDYLL